MSRSNGGYGGKSNDRPPDWIVPASRSTNTSSPSRIAAAASGDATATRPVLIALRKNTRENDAATTACTPAPIRHVAACSRALPDPKLRPATTTRDSRSRRCTSSPSGSSACSASSAGSMLTR
jgi:hypothetical protein